MRRLSGPGLLLAILSAPALAADRVVLVLPAGESEADWVPVAALAGLVLGPAQAGPEVDVLAQGSAWTLRARDRAGDEKTVSLARPTSAPEREDAIWVAVSLLESLPHPPQLPGMPAPPVAAPPVQPAPHPRPRPTPPVAAVAEPAAVAPPPPPPAPPAPVPLVTVPIPPPPVASAPPIHAVVPKSRDPLAVGAWVRAGPVGAVRPQVAVAGGLDASAGAVLGRCVWTGLEASWLPRQNLQEVGETDDMSSTDLLIGAGWSPLDLRVAPLAGASVGLSERAYAAHGVALTHFQTTLARLELGVAFALSDRWSLAAGVAVSADLFSTYLSLSDGTTLLLPRVQGAGSLSLRVHFP